MRVWRHYANLLLQNPSVEILIFQKKSNGISPTALVAKISQAGKQTDRQADRQAYRQGDRQTE